LATKVIEALGPVQGLYNLHHMQAHE
jgi:hypothetical protein